MNNENDIEKSDNKVDYYDRLSKKILDFLLGFFGYFLSAILTFSIFEAVFSYSSSLPDILSLILFIASIYFIYYLFKINRRFIAIGAIVGIVIPLLVFGACMMIIISMY